MPNSVSPSMHDKHRALWPLVTGVGCALAGIVLFAWRGCLQGDFQFDDYGSIVENQAIRAIWPLDGFMKPGRPFGMYSFALNYHFSRLDPSEYRLTNLLIHLTNVMLLFAGVLLTFFIMDRHSASSKRAVTTGLFAAAMIALMWGLHPLTTQAVTNIVQRFESLAAMGYLGAWLGLLLVIAGEERQAGAWKMTGLLTILLSSWIGMLSKEIFATAPLVILLFDRLITGQPWKAVLKTRWLSYLLMISPFLWFIPSVLRWFDPSRPSSMGFGLKAVSPWEYLRSQPEIILHYLRLSFWPDPLCFDYAWRVQQNPVIFLPLGALILGVIGMGTWLYFSGTGSVPDRRFNAARGMAGWMVLAFFLMLAPTSSVIPIADLCVEHRMYLPLAVVASGVCLLGNRARLALEEKSRHPGVVRTGLVLAMLSCLSLLGWRTTIRNRDYRDGLVLWNTVLEVRPGNPRAWFMLGTEYFGRNRFEEALPLYEKAVSFQMPIGEFHAGLADCLSELGRTEEALKHYRRAIQLKPNLAAAHNRRGVLHHRLANLEEAREAFQQAHELGLPEARYNLASVLIELGEFAPAVPLLEASLVEHPEFSLPARRLAWILATSPAEDLRDGPRARELLDAHYQITESDSPYVWDTHAAVLAEQRRFADAVHAAERAVELAEVHGDSGLTAFIRERLECYRQQRPWREEVRP